jgi:hypothetical protein
MRSMDVDSPGDGGGRKKGDLGPLPAAPSLWEVGGKVGAGRSREGSPMAPKWQPIARSSANKPGDERGAW